MTDYSNIIAEKYDLAPDATKMFMELLGLVEVAKNSHLIEKGAFNDNFYIIKKEYCALTSRPTIPNRLYGSAIPGRP